MASLSVYFLVVVLVVIVVVLVVVVSVVVRQTWPSVSMPVASSSPLLMANLLPDLRKRPDTHTQGAGHSWRARQDVK